MRKVSAVLHHCQFRKTSPARLSHNSTVVLNAVHSCIFSVHQHVTASPRSSAIAPTLCFSSWTSFIVASVPQVYLLATTPKEKRRSSCHTKVSCWLAYTRLSADTTLSAKALCHHTNTVLFFIQKSRGDLPQIYLQAQDCTLMPG